MMNIIGMKQSTQANSMMKVTASVTHTTSAKVSELRLGGVKRLGGQVFRDNDGYTIKGVSSMPTLAFVNLLKKENKGVVDVDYKNDLAGNEQISETEEPLWSVEKDNGNFHIKRNF